MTFEEAKKRLDYKFKLNGIEKIIDDIRNNNMKNMYEYGEPDIGCAILEIGYVDIEVNLFTEEQCSRIPKPGDKRPVIDYFVCTKHGESNDTWMSNGYLDRKVKVNWNADDWAEQLERDMFETLDEYVTKNGWEADE